MTHSTTRPAPDTAAAPVTGSVSGSTTGAVLGIDVGGTSIKARLVDGRDTILGEWRVPTPSGDPSGTATVAALAELVETTRAVTNEPVAAVGLVTPGIVDEAAGVCILSVNLGWVDVPIREMLAAAIHLPVAFGHDVRAGALAEGRSGAAAGEKGVAAFVPIGTGLASAFVHGGRVVELGMRSGEIGQVVLRSGRFAGSRVEQIASAGAVATRAAAKNAREVADRVVAGDADAIVVWNDAVEVLADALGWLSAVTGPDLIVLGGGLADAGDLLFEPLERALRSRLLESFDPRLTRAAHGDAAAIVGAGLLARDLIADAAIAPSAADFAIGEG